MLSDDVCHVIVSQMMDGLLAQQVREHIDSSSLCCGFQFVNLTESITPKRKPVNRILEKS